MKQKRIRSLLMNDINLLGYHLPLDAHPVVGNNAMLGQLWELEDITPDAKSLVRLGRLASPKPISEFIQTVEATLDRTPLHYRVVRKRLKRWLGAAAGARLYPASH